MDGHCQKWAAIGYWLGVVAFAISPNWDGLLVGWGICQIAAAIAG
jgi:hypothetical protein